MQMHKVIFKINATVSFNVFQCKILLYYIPPSFDKLLISLAILHICFFEDVIEHLDHLLDKKNLRYLMRQRNS